MASSLYREVRSVLLGRTMLTEDGFLRSMTADDFRMPIGVSDGSAAVRVLGVARRERRLETELNDDQVMMAGVEAMFHTGRRLLLLDHPEVAACFIRYVATRPAVLTVEIREGVPVVTAWAARGATGWISIRRAIRTFTANLPEGVTVSGEKPPEAGDEEKSKRELRKEKKARKKAEKQRRKQERRAGGAGAAGPAPEDEPETEVPGDAE